MLDLSKFIKIIRDENGDTHMSLEKTCDQMCFKCSLKRLCKNCNIRGGVGFSVNEQKTTSGFVLKFNINDLCKVFVDSLFDRIK